MPVVVLRPPAPVTLEPAATGYAAWPGSTLVGTGPVLGDNSDSSYVHLTTGAQDGTHTPVAARCAPIGAATGHGVDWSKVTHLRITLRVNTPSAAIDPTRSLWVLGFATTGTSVEDGTRLGPGSAEASPYPSGGLQTLLLSDFDLTGIGEFVGPYVDGLLDRDVGVFYYMPAGGPAGPLLVDAVDIAVEITTADDRHPAPVRRNAARPTRLYPRDDAGGVGGAARIYPPPRGTRRFGSQP